MNTEPAPNVQSEEDSFVHSEKKWVIRAKQGDKDAFRLLFEHYFPKVYASLYHMLENSSLAEDLTQTTMIQAWTKLHQFDSRSTFGTWLYRIGINLTIDHLRRYKKQNTDQFNTTIHLETYQAINNPRYETETNETQQAIDKALAQLSEPHRAVFILGEIEGKTYEEIGQILKCKRGTIMSRMHYARLALQRLLKKYYES